MKLREALAGTGQVFTFTLRQFLRNRANNITLAIMVLAVLASMPVLTYVQGGEAQTEDLPGAAVTHVALDNQTDLPLSAAALAQDSYWRGVTLTDGPAAGADAVATVTATDGEYHITLTGEAGEEDMDYLRWCVVSLVEEARIAAAGVTNQQLDVMWSDYTVVLPGLTDEAPLPEDVYIESDDDFMDGFWVQYGYAIAVMMLCLMSASYVIRAVIEEKGSKLIELLLLSVEPLALLMGKIFAAMVYVLGLLALMIAGWAGSLVITATIFSSGSVKNIIDAIRSVLPAVQTDPAHLLLYAVVLVVSLLLGYLTMSFIGGLSGACCTSMEEAGSASSTVTLITMVGYLAACVVSAIPGSGVAHFSALCPVLSMFCAPVQYVQGNVGLWVLLVSWVIQAALVAGLAWLSARVYADLIIYRGSRVKWKQLFSMARSRKEAAR